MSKPENPRAFPLPAASFGPAGDFAVAEEGMTLRDWFAGQALMGMNTWTPCPPEGFKVGPADHANNQRLRAEWAYQQADALLTARQKDTP